MTECTVCPRNCKVNREAGQAGVCGVTGDTIWVARAALHYWEEPCISGENGSGTVFFCGCPLRCVYCQNYQIAHVRTSNKNLHIETEVAKGDFEERFAITIERLAEIFLELQEKKAVNINLVTPTHYALQIAEAVKVARQEGLQIPIVYNCSGYEKTEILEQLDGVVDIYLTDFKYMEEAMAEAYSKAKDYPFVAKAALKEMVRQQRQAVFDEQGMMKKGVIVRHLLLPGYLQNGKAVVRYLYETYGDSIYISLMNQYTPLPQVAAYPEINRKVTEEEYEELIDYAIELGVENGFIQEGETAEESFIPEFKGEGVRKGIEVEDVEES